jgi:ankyrin repeat protein
MRENSIGAKIDSALRMAAREGDTEIVKALLDAGADVHDSVDAPLWWAALGRHTETMRALIDSGADKDIALLEAAMAEHNGHTETVSVLKNWKRRGKKKRASVS